MTTALTLGGRNFTSRLLLGTARYPSPEIMRGALQASAVQIVTVSLRREIASSAPGTGSGRFWDYLQSSGLTVLPNTAGCRDGDEAIATARMARELFATNWIKLEVIGDEGTLQPDPFGLEKAAEVLVDEGFEVFPYTTEDLVVAEKLVRIGCRIIMPWGSPIGSGQGLANPRALERMRRHFPDIVLVLDAGVGKPSQAAQAMELGFDAVLLNTAVAQAENPVLMAQAFAGAVVAGRSAYLAGMMREREFAVPSTPNLGRPFSLPQHTPALS